MYHVPLNQFLMGLLDYCNRNGINVKLPKNQAKNSIQKITFNERKNLKIEKWNTKDLISFFSKMNFTNESIKLDSGTTIIDIQKFLESHILIVKNHNGENAYMPYYERLLQFKNIISNLE